jgi:hypothetical protein
VFNPARNEADAFKVLLVVIAVAAVVGVLVVLGRAIF